MAAQLNSPPQPLEGVQGTSRQLIMEYLRGNYGQGESMPLLGL
jgi:hypothetical protein